MNKISLLLVSALLLGCMTANAQNIYGRLNDGNVSFATYSYHTDVFTDIEPSWACYVGSATTDLVDNYFQVYAGCNGGTVWTPKLRKQNVVTKAVTEKDMNRELWHIEYDNGNIWSVDSFCFYHVDTATGLVTFYDSLFRTPDIAPPIIVCSDFNHATNTYYFTCIEQTVAARTLFCEYNIANKTLSTRELPFFFSTFCFSPQKQKCYFVYTAIGSGFDAGIYEYPLATHTLTKVYDASFVNWSSIAIDTAHDRMFFIKGTTIKPCTNSVLACYRINSRVLDTVDVSGRMCDFNYIEFLPTYIDTTWDGFPTGIPNLINTTGVQVYPNPAVNVLYITTATATDAPIYLSDIMGRIVLRGTLQASKAQLDVSGLATGQYVLRIGSSNSKVSVVH